MVILLTCLTRMHSKGMNESPETCVIEPSSFEQLLGYFEILYFERNNGNNKMNFVIEWSCCEPGSPLVIFTSH